MAKKKYIPKRGDIVWTNFDGVVKGPTYRGVAHFRSLGIPYVWPRSQKHTTPYIPNFLLSHPTTFYESITFDPAAGHEQMGKRPALILSPESFNKKVLLAMAAPITCRVRGHGFEVSLDGKQIKGVVLCQQVKMIDFVERGLQLVEKAPESVISDVLARVRAIVSEE